MDTPAPDPGRHPSGGDLGVRRLRRAVAERHRRLRVSNTVVGAALAAEGVLVLVLGNGLSLPVTASYLREDPVLVQGPTVPQVVFRLAIAPAVAAFLFLAAADHLTVALPGVHRWYERGLSLRANYARWIEYSVSASIMMVLIVLFVGVRDLAALLAVFAATSAMILFGLLMERQQLPGDADWSAFWFGSVIGLVPWVVVAVYVVGSPRVPGFVFGIIGTQFVLYFSFGVNMALQYLRVGRWRSYVFGEAVYLGLSLTAKSLLAWLIFANVLRS